MASNERVGWALSVLKHLPSKNPVTAETTAFYALGLRDLADDDLTRAVGIAASRCTFLPTPAELRDLAGANRAEVVDAEAVLTAIAVMATYLPTTGTTYPRVEAVRERLGDGVANAYGAAGGGRIFAGSEVTRDIARREFEKALAEEVADRGADDVMEWVHALKRLPSPENSGPVYFDQPGDRAIGGMKRLGGSLGNILGRITVKDE